MAGTILTSDQKVNFKPGDIFKKGMRSVYSKSQKLRMKMDQAHIEDRLMLDEEKRPFPTIDRLLRWKKLHDENYPVEVFTEETRPRFDRERSIPKMKRSHGGTQPELYDFKYSPEGKETRNRRFIPEWGWGSAIKQNPSNEAKKAREWGGIAYESNRT